MPWRSTESATLDDHENFASWVAPHLGSLRALAAREVDASAADDVVQEALVRAWQRRSTYNADRGSTRAWLVGILLDRARRHRVRRPKPVPHLPDVDTQPGVASAQRLDVEAAVRQLPPRQRQIVTLHYLADLPVTEVGALLGVSAGAIKAQLSDARARLRQIMEDDHEPR